MPVLGEQKGKGVEWPGGDHLARSVKQFSANAVGPALTRQGLPGGDDRKADQPHLPDRLREPKDRRTHRVEPIAQHPPGNLDLSGLLGCRSQQKRHHSLACRLRKGDQDARQRQQSEQIPELAQRQGGGAALSHWWARFWQARFLRDRFLGPEEPRE